jgi:hypothetical protein
MKRRKEMATCNICGIPTKACPVYDDKTSICGDCSFKLTIVRDGLLSCIDIMGDLFTYCPAPRDLHRVFSFIEKYMAMLFQGIASGKTARNLWNIITETYADRPYRFLSDEFFNNPDALAVIARNIRDDQYLLHMLGSKSFTFARHSIDDLSQVIPIETMATEGTGTWNLAEQLVLESLNDISDDDEEEQLY